ncbi:Crp/Fnr family transcriptional regulator [Devosia pacifica]|nr:Crp/Fnr family transcriptional regulator [Devosia pacifica]
MTGNHLVDLLSSDDQDALVGRAHRVQLRQGAVLEEPGQGVRAVYFPVSGLLSIIADLPRGRDIEIGVIGYEGMTGSGLALGDDQAPFATIVQSPGDALVIERAEYLAVAEQRPRVANLARLFARAFSIQIASTALANGRAKLEDRLARWLLMAQDRLDSDRVRMTHEFFAVMLGVRRAGVTEALHLLEGKHLIYSRRGEVIIRDREGLIDLADGSYGFPEQEYQRLLGAPDRGR